MEAILVKGRIHGNGGERGGKNVKGNMEEEGDRQGKGGGGGKLRRD